MELIWSPHARDQFRDILVSIARERSSEDAYRWVEKIDSSVETLIEHPLIGKNVPANCFLEPQDDLDRLRQLICNPFRIVYEATSVACYILSIRHCRMLLRSADTSWN